MAYTSGIYSDPSDDLDAAQVRKFELIAKKLELKAGDRLLDIGCGWGGFIIHAARHYGVDAVGVTLSDEQARYANAQIAAAGLESRCSVSVLDYRDITEHSFDAVASIEMFEAVGEKQLPRFFQGIYSLLKPGGTFVLQGICDHVHHRASRGNTFGQTYNFPDHELVPISTALALCEGTGFEIRDVECLRESYVQTLRDWLRNLITAEQQILQFVDPAVYRASKLYVAGLVRSFALGHHTVHQVTMTK